MKRSLAILMLAVMAVPMYGQASKKAPKKTAAPAVTAEDVKALRDALAAQQQQIQELRQELQKQQQQAAQLQFAASEASAKAAGAREAASQNAEGFTTLKGDVSDLKANATTTALSIQEDQKKVNEAIESPIAIHFKGITITPGGFLAAETVTRTRAMASDVNTPFNSIPFSASGPGHTPEFYGSGRQSRISLLAEGKLANMKLTGYFETDWLSAGVTSNNNQSNSYTNRQRQIWGQVATNNGWTVTGGQMWSLVTETRKGLDPRTEALPLQIDAQYVVGLSWARQFGMRVSKNFNNKFWLGMSIENAQVNAVAGNNLPANYFVGAGGNGGGLYNATANYAYNTMPDMIFKAAYEPNNETHFEVFGVVSRFRDRIYPNASAATPSAAGAYNDSKVVGGVGANARSYFANRKIEVALHGFGGQGVGRYGNSGLPDLTVHPNGTLAPLHAYQGLGEIDLHFKKWDWYFDTGAEYVARAAYLNAAGTTLVGYGVPGAGNNNSGCATESVTGLGTFTPPVTGSCTANTRVIVEGTFGFWYKLYNGPKGRIQFGPQYAYVVRNTWRGVGGDPNTNNNIILTSFRYYLP